LERVCDDEKKRGWLNLAAVANNVWQYRLLRYVPNVVSAEFYNIAVLLYDANENLVDARFATEFRRIACHPLVDLALLEQFRDEFEERRLLGEGFSEYIEGLDKYMRRSFDLSASKSCLGGDPHDELERIFRQHVASPSRLEAESRVLEPGRGTRRYLRGRIDDAFHELGLFDLGVERDREVRYGPDRAVITLDYAYQPNGHAEYIQALGLRDDLQETMRLGFVKSRLGDAGLSVVVDERTQSDVLALLRESGIRAWPEPELPGLAAHVLERLA
jgi:hypothetical protein